MDESTSTLLFHQFYWYLMEISVEMFNKEANTVSSENEKAYLEANIRICYFLARCQIIPRSIELGVDKKMFYGKTNCLAFFMVSWN
jgi:hypothetical protein